MGHVPESTPELLDENSARSDSASVHVVQILRRQNGYSFGGPDPDWCEPSTEKGIDLAVDPDEEGNLEAERRRFTGCRKYGECDLIPDELRWLRVEDMTAEQRELLLLRGCYRAPGRQGSWDIGAVKSRKVLPAGEWIANPFGIRTKDTGEIVRNIQKAGGDLRAHKDVVPCPIGGCIVPEMERLYDWRLARASGAPRRAGQWHDMAACPFYFRHVDAEQTAAVPNLQRFTQCYVTLPQFREFLRSAGVVVVAPVFRSSARSEVPGDSYWYPFYSGYGILQMPTAGPEESGWHDPTLSLRWHATALERQQITKTTRELPISKLFAGVEEGTLLAAWERKERLVSISEGQATSLLLQWVLMRRAHAAERALGARGARVNLNQRLEWLYETIPPRTGGEYTRAGSGSTVERLCALGYDVGSEFSVEEREVLRTSTLDEDFRFLGLVGKDGEPTERVQFALRWLLARVDPAPVADSEEDELSLVVREWIRPGAGLLREWQRGDLRHADPLAVLCWTLLIAALDEEVLQPRVFSRSAFDAVEFISRRSLRDRLSGFETSAERHSFGSLCRLVPPVHLLVRKDWTQPLRWLFVPLAEQQGSTAYPRPRLQSGLILMLCDDLQSRPYENERSDRNFPDLVLGRLRKVLPALHAISSIEEGHVREELLAAHSWWEGHRLTALNLRHFLATVRQEMAREQRPDDPLFLSRLLRHLELRFTVPPERFELLMNELMSIDLVPAAQTAIEDFTTLFWERKRIQVQLLCSETRCIAAISPLDQRYAAEPLQKHRDRTFASLVLLLLDLLVQRKDAATEGIILVRLAAASGLVSVEVETATPFRESLCWSSPPGELSDLKRGRGFFVTFGLAKALGSVRQEITNQGDKGILRIIFKEGSDETRVR